MNEIAAPAKASWTRERIEEVLRSEPFNYQAIKLPFGLSTGGHDRSTTADIIFPEDMTGQNVLDIGSALGFFCFEARRRGASRVVGIDIDQENVRKASVLADILGEDVEFARRDIEKGLPDEKFDHVLCLNVLHHLSDPILGLDRLIAAASRRLVLEIATIGAHDRRKLGMNWLQQKLLGKLPALIVGTGTADYGVKQFYLTSKAIENLLRYRRGCFASVEILPSPFKERFLVIAHKRRIDRLLVVSGPIFSNVEGAIANLKAGRLPRAADFDLARFSSAPVLAAENYHEPQAPHQEALVLSYDLMRPYANGAGTYDHDPSLDVIDGAKQASVLTVWAPPEELAAAARARHASATGRNRKRLSLVSGVYGNPAFVIDHYQAWFDYVAGKNCVQRVLLPGSDGPRLATVEEWRRDVAQPLLNR
jgi:2-polyprenyl-3-methyl-5-hydroxy-6-metoxy-1,4-benzoquinol methylase